MLAVCGAGVPNLSRESTRFRKLFGDGGYSTKGGLKMDSAASGLAGLGLIFFAFCAILTILWILVPFAIFGIKGKLDQLIGEHKRANDLQKRSNELLQYLAKDAEYRASQPPR